MGVTAVGQLTLGNSNFEKGQGNYLDNKQMFKTMRVRVFECDFYIGFTQIKVPVRQLDFWNV